MIRVRSILLTLVPPLIAVLVSAVVAIVSPGFSLILFLYTFAWSFPASVLAFLLSQVHWREVTHHKALGSARAIVFGSLTAAWVLAFLVTPLLIGGLSWVFIIVGVPGTDFSGQFFVTTWQVLWVPVVIASLTSAVALPFTVTTVPAPNSGKGR